jgi:uncharacterized protein (DUF362 family)
MTMAGKKVLSRRRLISSAGILGGALALADISAVGLLASPAPSIEQPAAAPRLAEAKVAHPAVAAPAVHRPVGLLARPAVAIGACADYGPAAVEGVLRDLVARLGGLGGVVHTGDTVVIKPNLTGGGLTLTPDGLPSVLTYITHPDVLRAIALLAKEAGAGRILLAESYAPSVWEQHGYGAVITELGLELLNLASPAPESWYTQVPVPAPLAFSSIWMNNVVATADVYISVSKMKCHADAGITLSVKNSIGYLPMELYRVQTSDRRRTLIHAGNYGERLPRILVDTLQARPIDFCVIDGISTLDQGEGPWNEGQAGISLRTVRPQILIAGRNAVAVDAVGAACMGFDPQALPFTDAFLSGWNYLALAAAAGLGPNDPDEIDVLGLPIAQALYPFRACPNQSGITPTPTMTPSVTPTPRPTETPALHRAWLPLIQRKP